MAIQNFKAKIKSIEEISKDVKIFTLELDKGITFRAGQFLTLIVEENGKRFTAPYSIASSPKEKKQIQFAIKLVNAGNVTSRLWKKIEGDEINLMGPRGGFGIKNNDKDNLIFIGTGTGIAPLKSMIKSLLEENTKKSLTLIFGERFENQILFEKELQELENKYKNFKFIRVISKPSENYVGRSEPVYTYINATRDVEIGNSEAYLCGMSEMVEECKEKLIKNGMEEENIFFEKY